MSFSLSSNPAWHLTRPPPGRVGGRSGGPLRYSAFAFDGSAASTLSHAASACARTHSGPGRGQPCETPDPPARKSAELRTKERRRAAGRPQGRRACSGLPARIAAIARLRLHVARSAASAPGSTVPAVNGHPPP